MITERNPNRENFYYASHVRADRGENKLHDIFDPIELKFEKLNMPLTLIYGNLETTLETTFVLQHLPELTSVEKVQAILPVFSREMAQDLYYIIQKHPPWGAPVWKEQYYLSEIEVKPDLK